MKTGIARKRIATVAIILALFLGGSLGYPQPGGWDIGPLTDAEQEALNAQAGDDFGGKLVLVCCSIVGFNIAAPRWTFG